MTDFLEGNRRSREPSLLKLLYYIVCVLKGVVG
jgi:hypothetical protein